MNQYNYKSENDGMLAAEFSFTDVDGNKVTGKCFDDDICDLLDNLGYGYLYNEALHLVKCELFGSLNGVVDITKPIYITILPSGK